MPTQNPFAGITGKASSLKYHGLTISFTSMKPKHKKKMADTRGSHSYDPVSKLIWQEQLPTSAELDFAVEGNFDRSVTGAQFLQDILAGDLAPQDVDIMLDAFATTPVPYGYGKFDLTDFELGIPFDDKISFSCSLVPSGPFKTGARPA